jgi:putative Holliday junction resolvase
MQTGRRVALDVGKARIGVAVSDQHSILASPQQAEPRVKGSASAVAARIRELPDVVSIFVGLPVNLKAESTESTRDCVAFAIELQALIDIDVRLVDERFSTKIASQKLSTAGKNSKQQRLIIDSEAASVILESAIEFEKRTGDLPGTSVSEYRFED